MINGLILEMVLLGRLRTVIKSFVFVPTFPPMAQLHTHLKPPKANQTLKEFLVSKCTSKVLLFFKQLLTHRSSSIDSFSFLFVLKACIQKRCVTQGKQLHCLVIKFGFDRTVHLQTCLLNLYSARGCLSDAHRVFDEISSKNIVCWTALISAYVDNQKPTKALQLFRRMQLDKVEPDQVTLTVALSACADAGALETGEWINSFIHRTQGLSRDLSLYNALINMYAKCGDIVKARRLFDSMRYMDVTTYTAMIVGHALHGQAEEALKLFRDMKELNRLVEKNKSNQNTSEYANLPNDVTFIGVLMACSHAGLVYEGKQQFKSMTEDYGLKPREAHFGCMLDLFCRGGHLKEAYEFILSMPMSPNAVMWRTLLGACSLHGNIELGATVRQKLLELEPAHVGDHVAMSNIYATNGMWNRKTILRDQIKQSRPPGCSSIELEGGISEFVTADDNHPLKDKIFDFLGHLIRSMKAYGYIPKP